MKHNRLLLLLLLLCITRSWTSQVSIEYQIPVDEGVQNLTVTFPAFGELAVDDCVDKVYPSSSDPWTFSWVLVPNCVKDGTLHAYVVYQDLMINPPPPSVVVMSGVTSQADIRSFVIPQASAAIESSQPVALQLPTQVQSLVEAIDQNYQWNNERLLLKLDTAASGALSSRTLLQTRRYMCPLQSKLVCVAAAAGFSLWEITNRDAGAGHTLITMAQEQYYVPAASMIQVLVPLVPPFALQTEVATWVGQHRWSDGLETLQTRIYPSVAPSAYTECYCNVHMDCVAHDSRSSIASIKDLPSKADVLDRFQAQSIRIRSVFTNLVLGTGDTSILNTILLVLGAAITASAIIVCIRDASDGLPDTPEGRRFAHQVLDEDTYPYDANETERRRELRYAKHLRDEKQRQDDDDDDTESQSDQEQRSNKKIQSRRKGDDHNAGLWENY